MVKNAYTYLLVFPGPLWPLIISLLLFRKSKPVGLLVAGVLSAVIFSVGVTLPYYFCGYSDVQNPVPGPGLGWTSNFWMATYSYLYTSSFGGFLWLLAGLLSLVFGALSAQSWVHVILKAPLVVFYAWSFFEFHKFERTIHAVLE